MRQFLKLMLRTWEGGYQASPHDTANVINGQVIGTKYGVTPRTYARYYGIRPGNVTQAHIKALTLDEAADLAYDLYYVQPGWALLPPGPIVQALVDMGYVMGPKVAIKALQQVIGVKVDGQAGPKTRAAYNPQLRRLGPEGVLWRLYRLRVEKCVRIVSRKPQQAIWIVGWVRRAGWYLPGNPLWPLDSPIRL